VGENPIPRSIWWGRADWFVFVPWFLVLASFWIYLFGPERAPWTEAMHEFYGRRHTAEIHMPWVIFGSLVIFYLFVYALPAAAAIVRAGGKVLDDRSRDLVYPFGSSHLLGGFWQLRRLVLLNRGARRSTSEGGTCRSKKPRCRASRHRRPEVHARKRREISHVHRPTLSQE
jgi:hypothetical protein